MAKAAAKTSTRPLSRVGDADLVERRRAQIVEAATRLVARQGFAKTVVRDIAEEANISVGLVYEYVRSKEDILFLIYEYWARVWGEGLEKALARGKDPLDQLMSGVSFLVSRGRQAHRRHAPVLPGDRPPVRLRHRTGQADRAGDGRPADRRAGGRRSRPICSGPRRTASPLATQLILLCHGWVLKGYLLRKGRTAAGYATSLVETAVNGWATAAGRKAWERRRG